MGAQRESRTPLAWSLATYHLELAAGFTPPSIWCPCLVAGTGAPPPPGTPLPLDVLAFPAAAGGELSRARLLTAGWLAALPSVCALAGCAPGDTQAVCEHLEGCVGSAGGTLLPLLQALAKDVEAWEE